MPPAVCATTACFSQYLYTGKERDAESGNDYFKYRYYASTMGRWLSPDPSGLTHADLENPQSFNLYNYVGNRPLTLTDLDGLCWAGFQWACNIVQRVENRALGFGFQTDDQIDRNPNKRSQKKIQSDREKSYRREHQPAPSLPKPGTPGYIDVQLPTGPQPRLTVRATPPLTPAPMPPSPADCVGDPDNAMGIHQLAMQAWSAKNNLPAGSSPPSDDDAGGGGGTGGAYLNMRGNGLNPLPSMTGPMANPEAAAGASGAALLADRFAGAANCLGSN
jgi:RHS repeat-associated protein